MVVKGSGDWELGIGDWGLGIGNWELGIGAFWGVWRDGHITRGQSCFGVGRAGGRGSGSDSGREVFVM